MEIGGLLLPLPSWTENAQVKTLEQRPPSTGRGTVILSDDVMNEYCGMVVYKAESCNRCIRKTR